MDKSEFRAQIETLPPGMRFVVRHVLPLCAGVFVVFGALLVVVLLGHDKQRVGHRGVLRRGHVHGGGQSCGLPGRQEADDAPGPSDAG